MDRGMVIIGAGECGGRAALALRELAYDGQVTLIGEEPIPPYERPPLSKEALTNAQDPVPKLVATKERLDELSIRFLPGTKATALDRDRKAVLLSDRNSLPYDKLLLTTGARPRRLNLPGAEGERCHYLREFPDAQRLRKEFRDGQRIAIIGGGFIGLELAASARRRGAQVVVVEALPRILSRGVPEEIAAIIAEKHSAEGVELMCGMGIEHIDATNRGAAVVLANGESVLADQVVIGVGAVPETGLAAAAGLAVDNGIAVDERLQTSDPHIFAAGDCCSFPLAIYGGRRVRLESWRNALDQAALAAANLLDKGERISAVPWFWSDQYDLTLQVAGLADTAHRSVRREIGDGGFILFHLGEDGRLLAASGIAKGNAVAKDIRLAEMLIAKRTAPDPDLLGRPDFKLKSLLAA